MKILTSTLLLFSLAFFSCQKERITGLYTLNGNGTYDFYDIKEGQVLSYRNQSGIIKQFAIDKIRVEINTFENIFRYQSKIVTTRALDGGFVFEQVISAWPSDLEKVRKKDYIGVMLTTKEEIRNFPYWNGIGIDSVQQKLIVPTIKTNVLLYPRTYPINAEALFAVSSNLKAIDSIRNVNVVYYLSSHWGIIGFDDLNGNEWRLIDPAH